jgi:glucose/arabinose dehydrogenase
VSQDNPFVGKKNSLVAIWGYGQRNPQGISYDKQQQRL